VSGIEAVFREVKVSYGDKRKLFMVLGLLLSGKISLGKAAELLGIRIDDLWALLEELDIKYHFYDSEEAEIEVEQYRKILGNI